MLLQDIVGTMSNRSGKSRTENIDRCLRSDTTPPVVDGDNLFSLIGKQQAEFIKTLDEKINTLTQMFNETIKNLRGELGDATNKISKLECKIDDLEQYSRRHNLRVYGIQEVPQENTEQHLVTLFENKLGITVNSMYIDRSHRLGPKNSSKPRPVLVKFTSYKIRRQIFTNKKLLKKTGFVIMEDLTKTRLGIFKAACEKYGKHNVWTSDGVIKVAKGDVIASITRMHEV